MFAAASEDPLSPPSQRSRAHDTSTELQPMPTSPAMDTAPHDTSLFSSPMAPRSGTAQIRHLICVEINCLHIWIGWRFLNIRICFIQSCRVRSTPVLRWCTALPAPGWKGHPAAAYAGPRHGSGLTWDLCGKLHRSTCTRSRWVKVLDIFHLNLKSILF